MLPAKPPSHGVIVPLHHRDGSDRTQRQNPNYSHLEPVSRDSGAAESDAPIKTGNRAACVLACIQVFNDDAERSSIAATIVPFWALCIVATEPCSSKSAGASLLIAALLMAGSTLESPIAPPASIQIYARSYYCRQKERSRRCWNAS